MTLKKTQMIQDRPKLMCAKPIAKSTSEITVELITSKSGSTSEPVDHRDMNKVSREIKQQPDSRLYSIHGGASECGLFRSRNEDAIQWGRITSGGSFMVVCDGLGGIEGGAEASRFTAENLASQLKQLPADSDVLEQINMALVAAQTDFKQQNIPGRTTVIIAVVKSRFLYYAYIGDGALNVLYPNGQVLQLLTPQRPAAAPANYLDATFGGEIRGEPVLGSLRLSDGCAIFAMTDGASDLSDGMFPAKLIGKFKVDKTPVKQIASVFVAELMNAKDETGEYLHSDNLSAAFIIVTSLTMMKNLEVAYEAHIKAR